MLEQPGAAQAPVGGGLGDSDGGITGDPLAMEAADRGAAVDDLEGGSGEPCEAAVDRLLAENAALKEQIVAMESAMALADARHGAERALLDAGVIDLETAMALAEPHLAAGDPAETVVSALVAGKPFLFAKPGGSGGSSSGSASSGRRESGRTALAELADEAKRTGDRRALTRYLRGRRSG